MHVIFGLAATPGILTVRQVRLRSPAGDGGAMHAIFGLAATPGILTVQQVRLRSPAWRPSQR